jgi:hypothetical protein
LTSLKTRNKRAKTTSIDWKKWHRTRIISLAEAVLLALGRDPTGYNFYSNPLEPFAERDSHWGLSNPAKHLFSLAMSALDRPGGLETEHLPNLPLSNRIPYVDIRKFSKWITSNVTSNVPDELVAISQKAPTVDGMVTYTFPYEIPFIAAAERVVRENYMALSPSQTPNQKKAGLEFDEAMGWNNASDPCSPTRNSKTIVAELQPKKYRTDPKRRRRKQDSF